MTATRSNTPARYIYIYTRTVIHTNVHTYAYTLIHKGRSTSFRRNLLLSSHNIDNYGRSMVAS